MNNIYKQKKLRIENLKLQIMKSKLNDTSYKFE